MQVGVVFGGFWHDKTELFTFGLDQTKFGSLNHFWFELDQTLVVNQIWFSHHLKPKIWFTV